MKTSFTNDNITPKRIEIARPAPLLNTADFSLTFSGPVDLSYLEWVALPGMQFEVVKTLQTPAGNTIYQILSPSYPIAPLYLDARFTGKASSRQPPSISNRDEILQQMVSLLGTPYIWGGNWHSGIPELLDYYPPKGQIDNNTRIRWTLSGVDCSGLLFQIMNGATPRNTSQLIHFGHPIPISHLTQTQIRSHLEPLDMILYKGHVLFVLDSNRIIESKSPFGVIQRNLDERLEEIMQTRQPQNEWSTWIDPEKQFIARRFWTFLTGSHMVQK